MERFMQYVKHIVKIACRVMHEYVCVCSAFVCNYAIWIKCIIVIICLFIFIQHLTLISK